MAETADTYVRRIRNPEKRRYACWYANYLLGIAGPEPTLPIGLMAKQAVRLRLLGLLKPIMDKHHIQPPKET